MVFWSDIGIVLSSKKHGEKYKIVDVFTQEHGKVGAMFSISKNSAFSVFSNVSVDYSAKTNASLGFWKLKSESQNWIFAIHSFRYMQVCQSIVCVLNKVLPYSSPHEGLFDVVNYISKNLRSFSSEEIFLAYVYFELVLLQEIGFGIENTSGFKFEKSRSIEAQIGDFLKNEFMLRNLKQILIKNGEIIRSNLLDINNYYRRAIITSL